jgi:hypothetical protein
MTLPAETPNAEWYLRVSRERGVTPRCPFATVERCPRYYQSLSLLGEAGSTKMPPDEDERLKAFWEKSDLWPRTAEQAPYIFSSDGRWMSLSEFCPEAMHDRFGFFVKDLGNYFDGLDRGYAYEQLEKEGVPRTHWRWQWEWLKALHFTECPLYSPLSHRATNAPKVEERREAKHSTTVETSSPPQPKEMLTLKITFMNEPGLEGVVSPRQSMVEAHEMNQLVAFTGRTHAVVAAPGERASYRFFEFFTHFPACQ